MQTLRQKLVEMAIVAGDIEYAQYLSTARMTRSTMRARLAYYNAM